MSAYMEQCQLPIGSNGGTLYELAHMYILSIVLSHHLRESLYSFANTAEGVITIGTYNGSETIKAIISNLKSLVMETDLRRLFDKNLKRFNFLQNKSKIVNFIKDILAS